ncbi:MAG: hypothetical protein II625_02935 [Bacilli bacterium]|nr:hypothetical protein [Bacilli bacterium]
MANPWSQAVAGDVVVAGGDRLKIYFQQVTSSTTGASNITLTADDKTGQITEISGFGSETESVEVGGYAYKKKGKLFGTSTLNDLSVTQNLVLEDKAEVESLADAKQRLAIVITYDDGQTGSTEEIVYGCIGTLGSVTWTLPDGEPGTLSYTIAQESEITGTITVPA